MSQPFFSIDITTYNRRRLLKEALDSILFQSFTDFEGLRHTKEILGRIKNCHYRRIGAHGIPFYWGVGPSPPHRTTDNVSGLDKGVKLLRNVRTNDSSIFAVTP